MSPRKRRSLLASATPLPTRLGMVTSRPWIAIRIAVIALRKAVDARMKMRNTMRLSHSRRSRKFMELVYGARPLRAGEIYQQFPLYTERCDRSSRVRSEAGCAGRELDRTPAETTTERNLRIDGDAQKRGGDICAASGVGVLRFAELRELRTQFFDPA